MTELSRAYFAKVWAQEGEPYSAGEAWLDLLQVANAGGVLPIISYTERWGWQNAEVADFFTTLERRGHVRAYDKTTWCLTYQIQDPGLNEDYELIWKIYPKRVAKQKGYHAYAATRKGRNGKPGVTARVLFDATLKYAQARRGEDSEFIMHPSTFFGPDDRWKEKHKAKTNSKSKGTKGWSRPTSRDLTKTPGAQTKGRSPTTKKGPPKKRTTPKNPRKKSPRKEDPLGNL